MSGVNWQPVTGGGGGVVLLEVVEGVGGAEIHSFLLVLVL